MRVVDVPISKLRFAKYNPRTISDADMAALKKSIQRFGLVDPVVVNKRGNTIVGGHQRVRAAREMGLKAVPVAYVNLNDQAERLLNLALNNIAGEWDLQKLAAVLRDLRGAEADLEVAGFDQKDIERCIARAEAELEPEDSDDDAGPLPAQPKTRRGQLLELGPHRLLCGDARDPHELLVLTGGEKAHALWTDPPYGVEYSGKTARALRIENDHRDGLPELLDQAFGAADQRLHAGAAVYVAHPSGPLQSVFISAFEKRWNLRQSLVWVKDAIVLGRSDYHYRHEGVLYGNKPTGGRFGRGGAGWYGGNDQDTVFEHPKPRASALHPTMKPVALVLGHLRNSTRPGEAVLDPFAGSGTTLIACHRLGRRALLMDSDPAYCDVIRARYAALAARKAA